MRYFEFDEIADMTARLRARAERWLPPDVGMMIECASESERCPNIRALLTRMYDDFIRCGIEGGSLSADTSRCLVSASYRDADVFDGFALEDAVRAGLGGREFELFENRSEQEGFQMTLIPVDADFDGMSFVGEVPRGASDGEIAGLISAHLNFEFPAVAGIGFADTTEGAAAALRIALCRPVDRASFDPKIARLERSLKEELNKHGGGNCAVLAVMAENVAAAGSDSRYYAVQFAGCMFRRAFEKLL